MSSEKEASDEQQASLSFINFRGIYPKGAYIMLERGFMEGGHGPREGWDGISAGGDTAGNGLAATAEQQKVLSSTPPEVLQGPEELKILGPGNDQLA